MGFMDWRANYNDEHQFDMLVNPKWKLFGKNLQIEGRNYPVAGATAHFESGAAARQRMTATRVGAGLLIAGPIGAIIGGMAKKDESKMFIIIELADGNALSVEARAKDEGKIRKFVDAVNQASAHWSA